MARPLPVSIDEVVSEYVDLASVGGGGDVDRVGVVRSNACEHPILIDAVLAAHAELPSLCGAGVVEELLGGVELGESEPTVG